MSDFQLRRPELSLRSRRPLEHLSLDVDLDLELDPEIQTEIQALLNRQPAHNLRRIVLSPSFAFNQSQASRLFANIPPPRPPLVPRGAGPATPRAAELSDLMKAIWKVPTVQQAGNNALDAIESGFQRGWDHSSTAERATIIGAGVVFAGGIVTGMMLDRERETLLRHLDGVDVSVPGVEGLSVRVHQQRRGGGATYRRGIVEVGADVQEGGDERAVDFRFGIKLDLSRYVP